MASPIKSKREHGTSRRKGKSKSVPHKWSDVSESTLAAFVVGMTNAELAVRFGYTRDGGAVSLGIYGDGDPFTEYCRGSESLSDWLEGFAEDYGFSLPS